MAKDNEDGGVIIIVIGGGPGSGGRVAGMSVAEHLEAAAAQLEGEISGNARERTYKVFLTSRVGGIE